MAMTNPKKGMFVLADGTNVLVTFLLVSSLFLLWSLMGGAILPKLMGHVGDLYGMSRAFIVPLACFAFVSLYGHLWPSLSKSSVK